mmetsp:Transcript_109383/g.223513  ORF Transcript_109383/g.223513 Transcript_109383/m.223513 type:complete len:231 (+) Transcript_109383:951-1643(+)
MHLSIFHFGRWGHKSPKKTTGGRFFGRVVFVFLVVGVFAPVVGVFASLVVVVVGWIHWWRRRRGRRRRGGGCRCRNRRGRWWQRWWRRRRRHKGVSLGRHRGSVPRRGWRRRGRLVSWFVVVVVFSFFRWFGLCCRCRRRGKQNRTLRGGGWIGWLLLLPPVLLPPRGCCGCCCGCRWCWCPCRSVAAIDGDIEEEGAGDMSAPPSSVKQEMSCSVNPRAILLRFGFRGW